MPRRPREATAGGPSLDGPPADLAFDVPENPESVARTIVLRRLDAAPRTRHELATDLRKRGVPDEVASPLLDRFVEVGLVNDAEYARQWVVSRQRTRGTTGPVLRQELRRKGIDDELIAAALAQIDPDDEVERARELVARKMASVARFDRPTQERRLVSMLVRRGYRQGIAFGIVKATLDAPADGSALW